MESPKRYKKLARSFLGANTLYQGSDHLLSIKSHSLSEDYLRLYYRDIQAVIIRKSIKGIILNLCFGILFLFFSIPAFQLEGGWSGFFFIITGCFLLLVSINLLRGPTCTFHVMTPVQTVGCPALGRTRKVTKVMKRLRPLIEGVQGTLLREALMNIDQEEKPLARVAPFPVVPARHERGLFHTILFSLLIFEGVLSFVEIYFRYVTISLLGTGAIFAMIIILVIALVKQTGSDLLISVKTITWTTIGYIIINFILGSIVSLYVFFRNPESVRFQWDFLKEVSALSPLELPWLLSIYLFDIISSLFLGIFGLAFLKKSRNLGS